MQTWRLFRKTYSLSRHRTSLFGIHHTFGSLFCVSRDPNFHVTCSNGYSSTTSKCNDDNKYNPKDYHAKDNHSTYLEQMMELEQERKQLFGANCDREQHENDDPLTQFKHYNSVSQDKVDSLGHMKPIHRDSNNKPTLNNGMSMQERNEERDLIYNFTPEETQAWAKTTTSTNTSSSFPKIDSNLMSAIHEIRSARDAYEENQQKQMREMQASFLKDYMDESSNDVTVTNPNTTVQDSPFENTHFTHLNKRGDQVSMVDVGHKTITRRVAKARSSIYLPPEVMDAFASTSSTTTSNGSTNEMMSTKGPIFSTARIAGIMGAKRTSEMIPLCHPLPLDNVHIDIWLDQENSGNRVIVECTCSVTHKTGVEMEALTGASIAALTIYDMVKAVSHRVRIESTELIRKSGGKRNVNNYDHSVDSVS
jgi:cyclic pyranopterin monophosphate synthase